MQAETSLHDSSVWLSISSSSPWVELAQEAAQILPLLVHQTSLLPPTPHLWSAHLLWPMAMLVVGKRRWACGLQRISVTCSNPTHLLCCHGLHRRNTQHPERRASQQRKVQIYLRCSTHCLTSRWVFKDSDLELILYRLLFSRLVSLENIYCLCFRLWIIAMTTASGLKPVPIYIILYLFHVAYCFIYRGSFDLTLLYNIFQFLFPWQLLLVLFSSLHL